MIKCQIKNNIQSFKERDSDRDRDTLPHLTVVIFERENNECVFVLFLYFSNLSTISLCNFISRPQFVKPLTIKGNHSRAVSDSFAEAENKTCRKVVFGGGNIRKDMKMS